MKRTIRSLALAATLTASGLAGCETNPTTGRSQFNMISRTDEVKMGAELQPQFTQEMGGEVNDPVVRNYVTQVGSKMTVVTEGDAPSLPWTFTVVNDPIVNAFALPGGKVFISRGLMMEMTSEAQLAAVLGHEIGHVTARHINDRMVDANVANVLVTAASVGVGAATDSPVIADAAGQAFSVGGQMVVLKFSRDQESESDSLGMRYMTRVGYDPIGARQVQEILKRVSASSPKQPEMFLTHPLSETRIQRIDAELKKEPYKSMVGNPQYKTGEAEYAAIRARLAQLPAPPKAK